jgi:hypothetical protein
MDSPMTNVPIMMRLGSPAPMKAVMVRMPITRGAMKMMLRPAASSGLIALGYVLTVPPHPATTGRGRATTHDAIPRSCSGHIPRTHRAIGNGFVCM